MCMNKIDLKNLIFFILNNKNAVYNFYSKNYGLLNNCCHIVPYLLLNVIFTAENASINKK